jgi:hypothetical protein
MLLLMLLLLLLLLMLLRLALVHSLKFLIVLSKRRLLNMSPRLSLAEPGMFETWGQACKTLGGLFLFLLLVSAAIYELVFW